MLAAHVHQATTVQRESSGRTTAIIVRLLHFVLKKEHSAFAPPLCELSVVFQTSSKNPVEKKKEDDDRMETQEKSTNRRGSFT